MGMAGCFAAIDAETLGKIRNDPSLMENYLHPDDGDGEPEYAMDVDKAWHGIHYLLVAQPAGEDGPLAMAVLGGEELGEDMGYGPARILCVDQVKTVAAALEALTIEEFRGAFNPAHMAAADIYPQIIWERDGQEALDYVVENFVQLVVFYRETAARGDGAVLWLS